MPKKENSNIKAECEVNVVRKMAEDEIHFDSSLTVNSLEISGIDYKNKDKFQFVSVIRLPDFVTKEEFEWAIKEATEKKKQDFSKVEFFSYDEGLCVQCMHIGEYDNEPETINLMHHYMLENGYELDITDSRLHHEIYLSNPRRCNPDRLKTVLRHPIRKRE